MMLLVSHNGEGVRGRLKTNSELVDGPAALLAIMALAAAVALGQRSSKTTGPGVLATIDRNTRVLELTDWRLVEATRGETRLPGGYSLRVATVEYKKEAMDKDVRRKEKTLTTCKSGPDRIIVTEFFSHQAMSLDIVFQSSSAYITILVGVILIASLGLYNRLKSFSVFSNTSLQLIVTLNLTVGYIDSYYY